VVAASWSPRYPALLAEHAAGRASMELLRRTPDGGKVARFRPAHARGPKRNDGGRITVGRRFFQTALKDYEDWPLTWWREAIQNSVDAGARNVGLGVARRPDGSYAVWCEDDGRGMSPEVLFGKFLVLGESGKAAEAGATGGFGKAKEMLLLPWLSWSVASHGIRVDGVGMEYQTTELLAPVRGTRVEVVMPADQCTNASRAREFVSRCHLPGVAFRLTVSDGGVTTDESLRAALRGGEVVAEVPGKARLHYAKRGDTGIYVRSNGVFMYSRWSPSGFRGTLIMELVGRSTDLLTANRDNIRDYELRRWFEDLVSKVAADTKSALQAKGKQRRVYRGTGRFYAKAPPREVAASLAHATASAVDTATPLPAAGGFRLSHATVSEVVSLIGDAGAPAVEGGDIAVGIAPAACAFATLSGVPMLGREHVERAAKQLAWAPDFFVMNDVDGWPTPRSLLPEGMTKAALRLAKAWAELVRLVFIKLNSPTEYGVGWCLHPESSAMYSGEGGQHWILLNPLVDLRTERQRMLDPGRPDDLRSMWASAVHEVTHCADGVEYHNEAFASALTDNFAKCADAWPVAVDVVSAVLGGADVKLREALMPAQRPPPAAKPARAPRAPGAGPRTVYQDRIVPLSGSRVAEVRGVRGAPGGAPRVVLLDLATGEEFGEIPLKDGTRAELDRAVAAAREVAAMAGGSVPRAAAPAPPVAGPTVPAPTRRAINAALIEAGLDGRGRFHSYFAALDVANGIVKRWGYATVHDGSDPAGPSGRDMIELVAADLDIPVGNTALSWQWYTHADGQVEVVAYLG